MHLSNITDQSDPSQTVFGLHEGMRTITQVDLKILLNRIMAGWGLVCCWLSTWPQYWKHLYILGRYHAYCCYSKLHKASQFTEVTQAGRRRDMHASYACCCIMSPLRRYTVAWHQRSCDHSTHDFLYSLVLDRNETREHFWALSYRLPIGSLVAHYLP